MGENEIEGKIITSYATGGVSGQGDNFGGLAGVNSGVIAASYATGSVSGNGYADVGGLVGDNRYTGAITAAYAEGSVSGRADRYGGLLGSNQGVVTVLLLHRRSASTWRRADWIERQLWHRSQLLLGYGDLRPIR